MARFLDAAEIGDLLGCSVRTVRRRIADGSIASVKIGGLRRVPARVIEHLIHGEPMDWSEPGFGDADPGSDSRYDGVDIRDTEAAANAGSDGCFPKASHFNRKGKEGA